MKSIRMVASLALVSTGLIGCGSEEDRFKLVPVTGTVTLNGKPLAGATVSFAPVSGNVSNTPGVDSTGPAGNYKLMFKGRSGVAPGKYKVSITPPDPQSSSGVPDAFRDDPMMMQFANEAKPQVATKKVEAGAKSEFEREVSDKGDVLDFDVKSS